MSDAAVPMLQFAVGNTTPIRLLVRSGNGSPEVIETPRPFLIIGRSRDCDVVLNNEAVAYRHAYLQVIGGRLACIDLCSATGIHWDGPPFQGWVSPQHRFRIGDTWLQLFDDGWIGDDHLPAPVEFKPRNSVRPEYGLLPQVDLELLSGPSKGTMWPINRVVTLVGRDAGCRITCADDGISKVHCSLLLLPSGLWAIDLLGKGGITVNGERVQCALLSADSELAVGRYRMKARYTLTHVPSMHAHFEGAPDPEKAAFLTRLNKLFRVEAYADTLILLPHGETPNMTYKEIHIESSRISELQTVHGFRHLVIDGSYATVLNSMVLDAVIAFCRAARGRVVYCNLSEDLLASIQSMNLDRIWPCVASRAEALQYVYST
jgi:pSer/pThr/pTyr-binding forkhead associated (FHA) protein